MNIVVTAVVAAAAAAAALGLAGGAYGWLDALSNLALVYGVIGLLGGAWALAAGRGPVVALAVLAMALSAFMVVPEFEADAGPTAPATAPGQIKLIQINAQRSNPEIARLARWLAAERPDFVAVTEARHDLRDLLRRQGWSVAGGGGDLMIFSRQRYQVMNRPWLGHEAQVNFVNATYASTSGSLEAVTAHVGWPISPLTPPALRDFAAVAPHLRSDRTLLAGDFNATPWSHELESIAAAAGLIRRDRVVPTWPAEVLGQRWPLPFLPIDHVYAGKGWATVKVERGPWVGSDHYPLIVTLAPVAPR